MSQEKLQALDALAAKTEERLKGAKTAEERQTLRADLEATMADMRAVQADMNKTPIERVQTSPIVQGIKDTGAAVADVAGRTGTDLNTAMAKFGAGLISSPYELAAMGLSAGEYVGRNLGLDVTSPLEQGAGYNAILNFVGGNRPYETAAGKSLENVVEAGTPAMAVAVVNPLAGGALFLEEMARQTLGDGIRSYFNDSQGANLTAAFVEMTPVNPTQLSAITGGVKSVEEATAIAQESAARARKNNSGVQARLDEIAANQAKASEYGLVLTRGEAGGNRVTMAIENSVKGHPDGGLLVDVDANNANAFMSWLQRSFKVAGEVRDPTKVAQSLDTIYQGFEKSQEVMFKQKTGALFNNLPEQVKFNTQPILDKIAEIEAKYNLRSDIPIDSFTNEQKGIRSGLDSLKRRLAEESTKDVFNQSTLTFDKVPSGEFVAKDISASEFQRILADIGRATFKGDNEGFAGIDRMITKSIGRDLGGSINRILDDAAQTNPDLAQLKSARSEFKVLIDDARTASQLPFIKMMDGTLDTMDKNKIIDTLLDMNKGGEGLPIKGGSQRLAMSLISRDAPSLLPEIRSRAIERVFEEAMPQDVAGAGGTGTRTVYNFNEIQKGLEKLEGNMFFADATGKKAFNEYKANLKPIVDRLALKSVTPPAPNEGAFWSKLARIQTEIAGVFGGTPARYTAQVIERVAETTERMMADPKAQAMMAISPETPRIVRKAMDQSKLSTEELRKLDAVMTAYRLRVLQDAGQMSSENQQQIEMQKKANVLP